MTQAIEIPSPDHPKTYVYLAIAKEKLLRLQEVYRANEDSLSENRVLSAMEAIAEIDRLMQNGDYYTDLVQRLRGDYLKKGVLCQPTNSS